MLRGVDLDARAGEVLGVLGPSGAGKSTLFRALVGEDPPDEGTISIDGAGRDPMAALAPRARRRRLRAAGPERPLGSDGPPEPRRLSAHHAHGTGGRRIAAARVGLEHRLDVRAGELSSGERRRLELARAVTRPRVCSCATSRSPGSIRSGPSVSGTSCGAWHGKAPPVILADHHVAEALRVCTHATLLLDGQVAVSAPAAEFPSHPLVRGRYLGTWQRDSLPAGHTAEPGDRGVPGRRTVKTRTVAPLPAPN